MDQNSSDAEDDNMPELGDGDEITKFIRSKTKAKTITNVMDNSDWEIRLHKTMVAQRNFLVPTLCKSLF